MTKRADVSIVAATRSFERWLKDQLPAVDRDGLRKKHKRMRRSAFEFLRATFYRWVQLWPEIAEDLGPAPRVLAVGDLHVENFGTWRDREGRLVWGINDFDEAHPLPYTLDLVRLATSARLMMETMDVPLRPGEACRHLLRGYLRNLETEAGRPIVLGEPEHDWLRQVAQALWESWEPLSTLERSRRAAAAAVESLRAALPRTAALDVRDRRAGLGSLGKPRFVGLVTHDGGYVARETKALTPSACAWLSGAHRGSFALRAARRAVRAPDPFYFATSGWLVRRLAPDCGKLELTGDADLRRSADILEYMGHETANVHRGTPRARERILEDLADRKGDWLKDASARALRITKRDWQDWRAATT